MGDVAVTERLTLALRYADVGVATYASLRVVGQPARTVTWVIEEPILLAALAELDDALPDPRDAESRTDAVQRALTRGAFAAPDTELTVAYILGVSLIAGPAWNLLLDCVASPRAVLFVTPSTRLARVPWGLLALPTSGPSADELSRAAAEARTTSGTGPARIPWQLADIGIVTEGYRLMELADVLMGVAPNIANAPRTPARWTGPHGDPPLLLLDPRIPGQRPDSALGSVLGRQSQESPLVRHFAAVMREREVCPRVTSPLELFRRTDVDGPWLTRQLGLPTGRMLFVGHVTAADDRHGRADRAALHLAAEAPVRAADLIAAGVAMPPRVALLACASGGDYRFDEATGLVAAAVLGGALVVTATLWSLVTTAGIRRFGPRADASTDPMADTVIAVDRAHDAEDAGCAVNRWQRAQMRRWRAGAPAASPLHWAALATFTVDGAR